MQVDLDRAERMVARAVAGEWSPDAPAELDDVALRGIAERFVLAAAECDVLRILLAVELRPGVGRVLDGLTRRNDGRPTVAALAAIVGGDGDGGRAVMAALAPGAHLASAGLVELAGDGPFPERIARVPETLWQRVAQLPTRLPFPVVAHGTASLAQVDLAPSTRAQAEWTVARVRAHPDTALVVVHGTPDQGPEMLANAIAAEVGMSALLVTGASIDNAALLPHVRREAIWLDAAVVVRGAPSAAALARMAEAIARPILVVTDGPLALDAPMPRRWRFDLELADLPLAERVACWRRHLAGLPLAPGVDLTAHAARLRFGAARIATAAASAREHARRNGGGIGADALRVASRAGTATSSLARRLEPVDGLGELVVPPPTRRELDLACSWARHGTAAFRGAAAGRPLQDRGGLSCLFHGPPGTGKTLAARAVAGELGVDLLRIDLSQVVNKYIGETEKNLAAVFDEGDASGAILFFDEADALFGKRSETKDAHDRYANIEVAFLLQRLEQHPGVCILATNLRQNIDPAFSRRFHVIAEFPLPGPDERREIWERHLVRGQLADDVDFGELGRRFALSGGDISNAAATALVLAASDGTAVAMRHLVIGVWRELRKSGRLVGADDFGPWRDTVKALDRAR